MDLTERVARAIAGADGLDWDEPCGYETEYGDCDSGCCIAELFQDHDPDYARDWYLHRAQAAIAAMQADAVPVAWMPIVDYPITSSAVDDSETGNTTDKLRAQAEALFELYCSAVDLEDDLITRGRPDADGTIIANASLGRWAKFTAALRAYEESRRD